MHMKTQSVHTSSFLSVNSWREIEGSRCILVRSGVLTFWLLDSRSLCIDGNRIFIKSSQSSYGYAGIEVSSREHSSSLPNPSDQLDSSIYSNTNCEALVSLVYVSLSQFSCVMEAPLNDSKIDPLFGNAAFAQLHRVFRELIHTYIITKWLLDWWAWSPPHT